MLHQYVTGVFPTENPSLENANATGHGDTARDCTSLAPDVDVLREKGVREQIVEASPASVLATIALRPAHPSNWLTAQLNKNWRVVDDPLQWILQRRKGNPRKKNSGWQDRSFCTTREGLFRCVRESCGEVDDEALAQLRALPEFHSQWEPSR
jgi:hypothetical protein